MPSTPSSLSNDPRCSPSLSVALGPENAGDGADLENNNGSIFHDGFDYPAELRWTGGNFTYGCTCRLRNCIRKCCRDNQGLRNSKEEAICQEKSQNDTTRLEAHLRLSRDQMSEEIQDIDELRKHFLLVQDNICPGNVVYALNPDEYGENKIVLQANGSFVDADGKVIPFWNYCIDWKVTGRIGILVCYMPERELDEET